MRRALATLLLATFAATASAEPAGERRLYRKTNGGPAKGTLYMAQLFQPRSVRARLVAKPPTAYTAAAQVTCRMASGKLARTKFERTVRRARYEIRVPIPKGELSPTRSCTVEAGGFKRPSLGRTRLTLTVLGRFGAPVVRPDPLRPLRGSAYVGGFLTLEEDFQTYGNKPLKTTYGWQRCDAAGANCADIAGATGTEYRPVQDDLGMRIRARVTVASPDGTGAAHTPPTAPVTREDPVG